MRARWVTCGIVLAALAAPVSTSCSSNVSTGGSSSFSHGATGSSSGKSTGGAPTTSSTSGGTGGATGGASTTTSAGSTTGSTTSSSTSAASTTSSSGAVDGGPAPCPPAQQAQTWAKMVQAPIVPLGSAALLTLAGLTLPAAQQILCPGTNLGDQFGDGSSVQQWGDNGEVWLDFAPATMKGIELSLWPGYVGNVSFHGASATDQYVIAMSQQIVKNGAPFQLDWSNATTFPVEIDELCRGLMATFTNQALDPPGTLCTTSGKCSHGTFGNVGFVYFKAAGIALWVADVTMPQPEPSTPDRLDLFLP